MSNIVNNNYKGQYYICRECQPLEIKCKFYRYYATKCVAYLDD